MVLSSAVRIMKINRKIGVGPRKVNGHFFGESGFRNVFCLTGNFLAALGKFLFELRHERFGALCVHFLKRGTRVMRHAISHDRDGRKDGQQDNQQ